MTEKEHCTEPTKSSWLKKISAENIIVAVVFFVIGGATFSFIGNRTIGGTQDFSMSDLNGDIPQKQGEKDGEYKDFGSEDFNVDEYGYGEKGTDDKKKEPKADKNSSTENSNGA